MTWNPSRKACWLHENMQGSGGKYAPELALCNACACRTELPLGRGSMCVQVLAVAGAIAVLGLWTLSRRGRGKQAHPDPHSPEVPHEALNMGNGLGARSRARHSND